MIFYRRLFEIHLPLINRTFKKLKLFLQNSIDRVLALCDMFWYVRCAAIFFKNDLYKERTTFLVYDIVVQYR